MSIWRPRTTGLLIGGLVIVIIAAAVSFMLNTFSPKTELRAGTGSFSAKVARDELSQETGLAGITNMKPTDALIMVFSQDETAGIWMKGMKVPIDIVWLDSLKKVTYIVKNVPIDPDDKVYKPQEKARYVIELPAGSVQQYNIKVGETVIFSIDGEDNS